MKYARTVLSICAIMSLSILANGCFVIGTAVGSSVAKKQDRSRPVIEPELTAINTFQVGEWVELVKKDGKTFEGKYVGTTSDSIPAIKLKMSGKRANQMFVLNEIGYILVGRRSKGAKITGTLLGLAVDGILWTIITIAINNAIGP